MEKWSKVLSAMAIGALVAAIGVVLMGYLAAVSVPREYISWFESEFGLQVAMTLLYIVQQVLGFGLFLFAAGYVLTRQLSLSPLLATACTLAGFWLYSVVGVALVYSEPVGYFLSALHWSMAIMLVVHLLCLVAGVALGKKQGAKQKRE